MIFNIPYIKKISILNIIMFIILIIYLISFLLEFLLKEYDNNILNDIVSIFMYLYTYYITYQVILNKNFDLNIKYFTINYIVITISLYLLIVNQILNIILKKD